jgi:small GTP-binding protein
MGMLISRLLRGSRRPQRIIMLGLDAAGKTTVLFRLKLGELVATIPTVGFHVETVQYKNLNMTIWDVGGQDKVRALWRYYYEGTDAIIFVVDSADQERFPLVRETIDHLMHEDQLRDAALLVLANKQDLPTACPVSELVDKLDLRSIRNRRWFIQSTVASSGDGLYEGLDWLATALKGKP